MAKSMKKQLLLAKVEATVGTDSTPTDAANAILCRGLAPELIVGDQVSRDLIRPYKGNSGKMMAGEYRRVKFEVELAGSGTPGVAPAWGPLLRACGFAETVDDTEDEENVTYEPVSGGEPTLTLYGFIDGIKYVMSGCKGTVNFTMNAKGIPLMAFEFIGSYSAATDASMPTGVDYSKFTQPLTVGKVNTPTFTFMGVSACTSAYSINLANTLAWRELINCAGAHSADRTPTGAVTMELSSIATKNWAEIVRTGATGAANIVHGTVAGNIVELQAPKILCNPFTLQDDQGIAMLNMPFDLMPADGDDELLIIVR